MTRISRLAISCVSSALSLLAGLPSVGQSAARLAHPTVRVTEKVDRSVLAKLKGTHPGVVDSATVGTRLAAGTRLEHMILVLQPSDDQEASLHTLLDAQQDKGSASFHKWLTPDDFSASFGVASTDIAKVSAWMTDSGLAVESVAHSGRFITFSGTVGSVETAFSTEMHNLTVNGEAHIANTTDISVPAALAPVVKGVKSLNDFFPRSNAIGFKKVQIQKTPSGGFDSTTPEFGSSATGTHYVGAGDLATIFNATPLQNAGNTGKGITISVLARSNISLADVETYRSFFGLPKNDPNIIVVGSDPGQNGDDIEAFLDAEMAGSLATGATVDFIVSSASLISAGIDTSGLYAVDNNSGDIITLSYGGCESGNGEAGTAFWNTLWEQAAAQGQTAFVSSGDSSAAGCDSSGNSYAIGGYAVNALGSSAYNVAVGGSMFVDFNPALYWGASTTIPYSTALGYIPEAPWNQGRLSTTYLNSAATTTVTGSGIVGGGGGISIYTARPSWQTGSGIPTNADAIGVYSGTGIAAGSPITGLHRLVPDVSFIAANGHDGTLFCAEGVCSESATGGLLNAGVVGGTSVAAPAMASAQALIDAANGGRQGNANIYYYALANQQYTASTTACQALIGTAASPAVTLPAATCNFHDIVAGSNIVPTASTGTAGIGFYAEPGYDEASGLGSVNIANVANNWSSVKFNATSTSLTLTPTTANHGANQAITIQVSPASGAGTPTGDVSIIASSITNAYGPTQIFTLSGGSFSGNLNTLPGGTYSVHAHYAGDTTFASSDSNSVTVTIGKEASQTVFQPYIVTPAGSVTPSASFTYGAAEIYIDTEVYGLSGNGVASGSVTYTVTQNGTALPGLTTKLDTYGTTYLLSGPPISAFYLVPNYPTLPAGSYVVTAAYSGDASFNSNTVSTSFTVNKATPAVTYNTSTAQITSGSAATLNFTIATPASATPATGTVQFIDVSAGKPLGTGTLSNGTVTFTTPSIIFPGANTITATYSGDANYAAATGTTTVTVGGNTTPTTTLTATGTASVGGTVTLQATLSTVLTTASTVSFYDSGVLLGTSAIPANSTTSTLAVTKFTAGTHNLTADFAGSSALNTSTGSLSLTIAKNTTAMAVGGAESSFFGVPVVLDGAFSRSPSTSTAPAVPPTGVISFYDGGSISGTLLGTATPSFQPGGYAYYEGSLSISTLTVGSHSIIAYYPGDNNYTASTSVAKPLTITSGTPMITVVPVSITYGTASATLSASIAFAGATAPTGAATFSVDGGAAVTGACTGTTSPRTCTATYPTGSLAVGSHTITVTEAADSNYLLATGTGTLTVTAVTNGNVLLNTSSTLSGNATSGYVVTVVVTNNGTGTATGVVLTGVTVGGVPGTPTPQALGSIQPGASVTTTVSVPSTAGADGSLVIERTTGTYSGGSFGGSLRTTLP